MIRPESGVRKAKRTGLSSNIDSLSIARSGGEPRAQVDLTRAPAAPRVWANVTPTAEVTVVARFRKFTSHDPINKDFALLIIRVGIGLSMLMLHGYGKISGGPERWEQVGGAMGNLGLSFAPVFWGFMAAFAEFFCSILLVLGVLFRPAVLMLAFTMFVAALVHLNLPADNPNSGWTGASHAIELLIVYVGLLFAGPGRYAFSLMTRKPDAK